jgi:AraC-like DNA-binding protein
MNYLILWKDVRLFVGSNSRPVAEHKHPVIQLVVAVEGTFRIRAQETDEWIYKRGLLIKPNHPHQCDATDVPILSLDIEADSALGARILSQVFEKSPVLDYPSETFNQIDFQIFHRLLLAQEWHELYAYVKGIFRLADVPQSNPRDERIDQVLAHIHENIHHTLTTEQLMDVACLSESRLLHLFKARMGLPIRNYILWYRLKVAFERAMQGASLTEAAHIAGFSDQSHFTRSCISMVGVPPSSLLKNSRFIQVSFLP